MGHHARLPLALTITICLAGCEKPVPGPSVLPPEPGKLTIRGQVFEPAQDAPVEGAQVCWSPVGTWRCATTAADGTYTLVTDRLNLPSTVRGGVRLAPSVAKEGFEYRQSFVDWDQSDTMLWSPGLQRLLKVDAGQTISATVYPQEASGILDDSECDRCKRIRIAAPRAGTLTIRLSSADDRLRLIVPPAQLSSLEVTLAVEAGKEIVVYVTGAVVPAQFELSTTLSAGSAR